MIVINAIPAGQIAKLTASGIFQYSALGANSSNVAGEPTPGQTGNAILNAPGSGRLEGQPFRAQASGYLTLPAGTYTATITAYLCAGTSGFTPSSSTALATVSHIFTVASGSSASYPFNIFADAIGDSTSGTLTGLFAGSLVAATAQAIITNVPTSVNFQTEPPLQFAVELAHAASADISAAKLDAFFLAVGSA